MSVELLPCMPSMHMEESRCITMRS